jgi:amino acid transporter
VSVAAGVAALTSAVPWLLTHCVLLGVVFTAAIAYANLRGVRESGRVFAVPTYLFIVTFSVLVGTGLFRWITGTLPAAAAAHETVAATQSLTWFLVLRAFASGCTALTGVEAISNGVSAFKPPKSQNAARTLGVMGLIAITLFLGVSYLAVKTGAQPSSSVSLLSEIARAVFPAGSASSALYFLVQAATLAILVLAANTSYQGFPRLAAVLASDRYFPRQFVNLGDRLVYSNGIVVLAGVAALLIWAFHADVIGLIHLYVIGVFTAFTLSQAGMVRYWHRSSDPGRRRRALVNGIGATATGLVTVIVIQTKFTQGAWMVIVAVPVLILLFLLVHRHYQGVARRLRARAGAVRSVGRATNRVVVYVEDLDAATELGAWYAQEIAGRDYNAVYVPGNGRPDPRGGWWELGRVPVETLPASDKPTEALLDYVWGLPHSESEFVTVVVPELFEKPSLTDAIRRRSTFSVKLRLRKEPGVVVTDVPLVVGTEPPPTRLAVRVLLSGVQAASLRAVNYARSLGIEDTRAFFAAFDEADLRRIELDWSHADLDMPLDVAEAPYRDLGDPLLGYLRALTADGETAVSVIMPELVFTGWQALLHNQRALYLKRLLLFEPRVILSSVPFHLR